MQLAGVWNQNEDQLKFNEWESAAGRGDFPGAWVINDRERKHWPSAHQLWDGTPLSGRMLHVKCLHGLGDAVQMFQYASRLRSIGEGVVYGVSPDFLPLARYFEGVEHAVAIGSDSPFTNSTCLEMLELPYIFRTCLDDLPIATKYLDRGGILKAKYTCRTARMDPHLRVGIASQGGTWDQNRWIPPSELRPMLSSTLADFIFLQGFSAATGQAINNKIPSLSGGLEELAGVIANLDLVISIDTLSAHLAGALGVPCWLLLKSDADWRWQVDMTRTPWYPRTRIFRQRKVGEWTDPLAEVTHILHAAAKERSELRSREACQVGKGAGNTRL